MRKYIWMFEKCSGTSSGTGRARAWRTRVRWPARRSRRSGELRAWGGAAVAQSRRIENLVLCQFYWQKCGEHVIIKSMSSKAIHCRPCRSSCTITAWYKLPLLIFNLLQTGLSLQTRLGLNLALTLSNKNSHFFQKIVSGTMPVQHMKGQPAASTYVREKGCLKIFTHCETPCSLCCTPSQNFRCSSTPWSHWSAI